MLDTKEFITKYPRLMKLIMLSLMDNDFILENNYHASIGESNKQVFFKVKLDDTNTIRINPITKKFSFNLNKAYEIDSSKLATIIRYLDDLSNKVLSDSELKQECRGC